MEWEDRIKDIFLDKRDEPVAVGVSLKTLRTMITGKVGGRILDGILKILSDGLDKPTPKKIEEIAGIERGKFHAYVKKPLGKEGAVLNGVVIEKWGEGAVYLPKGISFKSNEGHVYSLDSHEEEIGQIQNLIKKIEKQKTHFPKEVFCILSRSDPRLLKEVEKRLPDDARSKALTKLKIEEINEIEERIGVYTNRITKNLDNVSGNIINSLENQDFSKLNHTLEELEKNQKQLAGLYTLGKILCMLEKSDKKTESCLNALKILNEEQISNLSDTEITPLLQERLFFCEGIRHMSPGNKDAIKAKKAFKMAMDASVTSRISKEAKYLYHWNEYEEYLERCYNEAMPIERIEFFDKAIFCLKRVFDDVPFLDELEQFTYSVTLLGLYEDKSNLQREIDRPDDAVKTLNEAGKIITKIKAGFFLSRRDLDLIKIYGNWLDLRISECEADKKNIDEGERENLLEKIVKNARKGWQLLEVTQFERMLNLFNFLSIELYALTKLLHYDYSPQRYEDYVKSVERQIAIYQKLGGRKDLKNAGDYRNWKNFYEAYLLFDKAETEYQKRIYDWDIEVKELELLSKAKDSIDGYLDCGGELKKEANNLKDRIKDSIKRGELVTEFIEALNNQDIDKLKTSIKNLRKNEPDDTIWEDLEGAFVTQKKPDIRDARISEMYKKLKKAFENDEKFKDSKKEIGIVFLQSHVFNVISKMMESDVKDYPFLHLSDNQGNDSIYIDEGTLVYNLNYGPGGIDRYLYFSLSKDLIWLMLGGADEARIADETFDFLDRQFGFVRKDIEELVETWEANN